MKNYITITSVNNKLIQKLKNFPIYKDFSMIKQDYIKVELNVRNWSKITLFKKVDKKHQHKQETLETLKKYLIKYYNVLENNENEINEYINYLRFKKNILVQVENEITTPHQVELNEDLYQTSYILYE